jgi:transketolase C-terminal domain/subunit
LKEQKKIQEYLLKMKNPYQLRVGDMYVTLEYSENNKKFDECILNILKEGR